MTAKRHSTGISVIVPTSHSIDHVEKMRPCNLAKFLVLIIGLTAPGCSTAETAAEPLKPTGSRLLDWQNLRPADSPNRWLLVPKGSEIQRFDEVAPVYGVAPDILANAWKSVLAEQPRTKVVAVSDDGLQIEALQESAIFGFVDLISARISMLSENRSTIAVYSRSTVGYWDFGVNKRRVRDWLEALGHRIAAKR